MIFIIFATDSFKGSVLSEHSVYRNRELLLVTHVNKYLSFCLNCSI